jgi:hypothetical protein
MPVTQTLMAVGAWSLNLEPTTPRSLVDVLSSGYFGHVAIATGRHDPRVEGDSLLTSARYVGVLTGGTFNSNISGNGPQLSGDGMATWLATPNKVGAVIESPLSYTAATFATVINGLLPTSVHAGTIHSIGAATYTGAFVWTDPRTALTTFCGLMSTGAAATQTVEWRVNGNATLDAGHVSDLYVTTPVTAIVARNAGVDMALRGLPGVTQVIEDVKDFTSRVVVLAGGSGASTAVGVANIADVGGTNPYKDLFGNTVQMTRMVSASSVSSFNATAAAQTAILPYTLPRDQVKITSQEYDITGELAVGDYTYVYDPDSGIIDTTQEVVFRGQRLNPALLRVIELDWPVTVGMTVAFRDKNGVWYDLTDYVVWDSGDTTVVVGGYNRALVSTSEPVGPRPIPDTTIPGVVAFGAFSTTTYQGPSDGKTKAQIQVQWATPTNTDGTTITDGDHYEIQYRPDLGIFAVNPSYNGLQSAGYTYNSLAGLGGSYNQLIPQAVANWKVTFVAWGTNTLLIQELTPGVNYDFQIRAVDTAQPPNNGAWSATSTFQAAVDTIPPPTPDAPVVAANMASVQVTWDCGSAAGGTFNQAVDLHHIEVHGSYEPLFAPSSSTKLGNVIANIGNITGQIPVVASFTLPPGQPPAQAMYIKIIAVDTTGNKSQPSAPASATAVLWSNAYITDLSVSKLTAGTVTATMVLASSISTASSGARVSIDGGTDALYTYDANGALIGAWAGKSGTDPATSTAFAAGWTIFNDPGPGYFAVQSQSLGVNNYGAPNLVLTAQPSYSSSYSGMSVTASAAVADFEVFSIYSAVSLGDANASKASILLYSGGTGTDAAHGSLRFDDNSIGIERIRWDQHGVLMVGGELASTYIGNPMIAQGLNYWRVSMTVISGTTDGSGNLVFNHGASFTPSIGLVMRTTGGVGQIYVGNWTSTQGTATAYSVTGTLQATTGINFWLVLFG